MMKLVSEWALEKCALEGECDGVELYGSFTAWIVKTRPRMYKPMRRSFGNALIGLGLMPRKSSGRRIYCGISLK